MFAATLPPSPGRRNLDYAFPPFASGLPSAYERAGFDVNPNTSRSRSGSRSSSIRQGSYSGSAAASNSSLKSQGSFGAALPPQREGSPQTPASQYSQFEPELQKPLAPLTDTRRPSSPLVNDISLPKKTTPDPKPVDAFNPYAAGTTSASAYLSPRTSPRLEGPEAPTIASGPKSNTTAASISSLPGTNSATDREGSGPYGSAQGSMTYNPYGAEALPSSDSQNAPSAVPMDNYSGNPYAKAEKPSPDSQMHTQSASNASTATSDFEFLDQRPMTNTTPLNVKPAWAQAQDRSYAPQFMPDNAKSTSGFVQPQNYPVSRKPLEPQLGRPNAEANPGFYQPQSYPVPRRPLEPQLGRPNAEANPGFDQPQSYPVPRRPLEPQLGRPNAEANPGFDQPQSYPGPQKPLEPQFERFNAGATPGFVQPQGYPVSQPQFEPQFGRPNTGNQPTPGLLGVPQHDFNRMSTTSSIYSNRASSMPQPTQYETDPHEMDPQEMDLRVRDSRDAIIDGQYDESESSASFDFADPHRPYTATHAETSLQSQGSSDSQSSDRKRKYCRGCLNPIIGKSVRSRDGSLTGRWHRECFMCTRCETTLTGSSSDVHVHEDQPFCPGCYHVVAHTTCRMCGKGIEGSCLEATAHANESTAPLLYHINCLRCAECQIHLQQSYFEVDGATYCAEHAFTSLPQNTEVHKRFTQFMMI